ncbi:MAG: hypothetical protein IJO49_06555, partial [Clostridia bacterium]|nr:hypothetical protein [Clostridia bacterium]
SLSSSASRSDVELVIVKLCSPELASTLTALKAKVERLEKTVASLLNGGSLSVNTEASRTAPTPKPSVFKAAPQSEEIPLPEPPLEAAPTPSAPAPKAEPAQSSGEPVPVTQWPEILEILKLSCPLMAGVLADSKAYIGNGRLLIDSQLSQFKEMINSDAKYRDYIRKAAEQVLGVSYNLGPYKQAVARQSNNTLDPLAEFAKSLNNQN